MDWLDLLAVQGTLKTLLQNHSSKVSILRCSAFFMVQLSHPYMTTGKTIALTRQIFVSKVMSLLFNMLSRFVLAFLPRRSVFEFHGSSHHPQWLEPMKIVCHYFRFFPSIGHEVMGPDATMVSFKPAFSLSSSTFIQNPTLRCPYTTCVNWHHN